MCRLTGWLFALGLLLAAGSSNRLPAGEQPAKRPKIAISTETEEGEKMLVATVTLDGKPLEGVEVAFFVKRLFGLMDLGGDETLDDGTAAAAFPQGLPGGEKGELQVVAKITSPEKYAARAEAAFPGGIVVQPEEESFPRALWTPNAPAGLILTIVVLLSMVWGTYAFVIVQLLKIKKGAKP